MDEALYGVDGFYRTDGVAGRRGHFLTSAEVGPLFGAVVANFLDVEWERIGRPDPFTMVDAGAGPGTLARTVMAAAPRCASVLRYVAVELSEHQRSLHPAGVESRADLPDEAFEGVILANELLDNMPFRLVVFDGGWREALVVEAPDGQLTEHLGPVLEPLPAVLPERAPLGARAPLIDLAATWVDDARARLSAGTLVVLDYGVSTTAELANGPGANGSGPIGSTNVATTTWRHRGGRTSRSTSRSTSSPMPDASTRPDVVAP